jgi:hypothetical protein
MTIRARSPADISLAGDILIGGQLKLMDSVDVETPVGRWTYWISNRWSRTVTSAGQWVKWAGVRQRYGGSRYFTRRNASFGLAYLPDY